MKSVSICFVALAAISTSALAQIDPSLLHGLEARSIGPAGMSGRVAAIDAVVEDPNIIFVGSATGGVWKSVDGGLTWNPVFDDQPTSSIGAVAIFQANPDIVWIGTGEGNPRNSAGVGFGVYKSMDGGRSWSVLGLTGSERVPTRFGSRRAPRRRPRQSKSFPIRAWMRPSANGEQSSTPSCAPVSG